MHCEHDNCLGAPGRGVLDQKAFWWGPLQSVNQAFISLLGDHDQRLRPFLRRLLTRLRTSGPCRERREKKGVSTF